MKRKKMALLAVGMLLMLSGCGQSSSADFVSVRDLESDTQTEETTDSDVAVEEDEIIQQIPLDDLTGDDSEEKEYFILEENQARIDEVIYERIGKKGEDSSVFYYEGSEAKLTIPEDATDTELGDCYHVVEIADSAFTENETLEQLVLPETVNRIGAEAFIYCTALTQITLPEQMEQLGESAFFGCEALESILLPEGLETIETDTFGNCSSLKSIRFPGTLKQIRKEAFWYCEALETLELPEGLETIGERAFYNCSSLKTATFPGSLKEVSADIFEFCDQLETVYVPEEKVAEYEELFAGADFSIEAK